MDEIFSISEDSEVSSVGLTTSNMQNIIQDVDGGDLSIDSQINQLQMHSLTQRTITVNEQHYLIKIAKQRISNDVNRKFDVSFSKNKHFQYGVFTDYDMYDFFQKSIAEILSSLQQTFEQQKLNCSSDPQRVLFDLANSWQNQGCERVNLFNSPIQLCGFQEKCKISYICSHHKLLSRYEEEIAQVENQLLNLYQKQSKDLLNYDHYALLIQQLECSSGISFQIQSGHFLYKISESELQQFSFEYLFTEKHNNIFTVLMCPVCGMELTLVDYLDEFQADSLFANLIAQFMFYKYLEHLLFERVRIIGLFIFHQESASEALWRHVVNGARLQILKKKKLQ